MKTKKDNILLDALKAARKMAREEEIAKYGKTICYAHINKSKKVYTRKKKHKNDID